MLICQAYETLIVLPWQFWLQRRCVNTAVLTYLLTYLHVIIIMVTNDDHTYFIKYPLCLTLTVEQMVLSTIYTKMIALVCITRIIGDDDSLVRFTVVLSSIEHFSWHWRLLVQKAPFKDTTEVLSSSIHWWITECLGINAVDNWHSHNCTTINKLLR